MSLGRTIHGLPPRKTQLPLRSESVADFFARVMTVLTDWQIEVNFDPRPNELPGRTPFALDVDHRVYNPDHMQTMWQAFVHTNNVFKKFRSKFVGKCSPSHLFWGSFDLAVTRFSGRRAPEHPGGIPNLPDKVAREAYSHEVSSCGFWFGDERLPEASFYSYAYLAPAGYMEFPVLPEGAYFHKTLGEFILPYEIMRTSLNPEKTLINFLESTYQAAADLGRWDRELLEVSPYLTLCQRMFEGKTSVAVSI